MSDCAAALAGTDEKALDSLFQIVQLEKMCATHNASPILRWQRTGLCGLVSIYLRRKRNDLFSRRIIS